MIKGYGVAGVGPGHSEYLPPVDTSFIDTPEMCWSHCDGFTCTRAVNHTDKHAAHNTSHRVVQTWDDEDADKSI